MSDDIQELIKHSPYLEKLISKTIITDLDDAKKVKEGEKIVVDGKEVSVEFLKRLIYRDDYYQYALKLFKKEFDVLNLGILVYGDVHIVLNCTKSQIIKGIEELVQSKKIVLGEREQEKFNYLKNFNSFERLVEDKKDDTFLIRVDGNLYTFLVRDFITFMQLSDEEFKRICQSEDVGTINNFPKEHFIFALYMFFYKEKVMDDYVVPSTFVKRCDAIKSFEAIDLEAINKHLETKDEKFLEISVDEGLEKEIFRGIPSDASELEAAIYIYIKMCKLFTYDEEFYVMDQSGEVANKHRDISYVSKISLDNNKVVCFEFNILYSKFLNDLGIKFSSDYKAMAGEDYGAGHVDLEFRSGKFLVNADSVTSILQGDIARAKINRPLVGLKCINKNGRTKNEFQAAVSRMYDLIISQEDVKNMTTLHVEESFDELIQEYAQNTSNLSQISINEKVEILINKVEKTMMGGIDALSYIMYLKGILFSDEELRENVQIVILRCNDGVPHPAVIIALKETGFNLDDINSVNNTVYYYFELGQDLVNMTQEELQMRFDTKMLQYIEFGAPRVPGIEMGDARK